MRGALIVLTALTACAARTPLRPFPDRPVAWQEHDDQDTPRPEKSLRWEKARVAFALRELVLRRTDRSLAMTLPRPAEDVNALDEVPCSTWFCPKNHLAPLTAEALAAGPPGVPPLPPFRILKLKDAGASVGATVVDARGRKFLLKVDPRPWTNLMVGSELVTSRLFWAAGYHVPAAWAVDLARDQLQGHADEVARLFAAGARTADGRVRALAVTFIEGEILGGFDFQGRRPGDRNDRIPHQRRRSLRASWVVYGWTNYTDAGTANTVDSWQREGGRRFVRHYIVDFGSSLGSWTISHKPPELRLRSLLVAMLGRDPEASWALAVKRYPAVGYLEEEGWDPSRFKTVFPNAAHAERTPADEYWGAKVVTSFTDAQIAAAVGAAGYRPAEAAHVIRALTIRRDIIGRRYLAAATAVEEPQVRGPHVCFRDLAVSRGYAAGVSYRVRWLDGAGRVLSQGRARATGPVTCLPGDLHGYRVLELESTSRPARIHLRDGKIVGLEHE